MSTTEPNSKQLNNLETFRQALYPCLVKAQDALFETCDALLTEPAARSFAELSLSPRFTRQWPSLYAAFADGEIDRTALRRVFATSAPHPAAGQRLVMGMDASNVPRPESPTAQDRTYLYVHNLPECTAPVTVGWSFSSLVILPEQPSSWTYVLDCLRIPSDQTAGQVGAGQLAAIVPLLPERPVLTGDRYYGSAKFVRATAPVECDKLLRIPGNRVFYCAAPPRTGKRGAPKKDGQPFKCHDACTHGLPSATWQGVDVQGHPLEVKAWTDLHYQSCREVTLTVIQVIRPHASSKKRDPRISWFVWIGLTLLPLAQVWPTYRRRYSHEHGFRFDKQDLLWLDPRFRTPDQFQRWTDVMAAARNQLVLACPLAEARRQPWEASTRPATPRQVRRAMGTILATLGTPAQPPQPRGKSPGRQLGVTVSPAPHYPVVYKHTARRPTAQQRR
jgi:hypothetical protein